MNTFGSKFRLTTFGESHGLAVGGIIDGCPANIIIDTEFIESELARRKGPRNETDKVEFLSGLLEGRTLGTPIAFCVSNHDARSTDYEALKGLFRPGHGEYTYKQRYGIHDWRGGGRSSARETVARVVAGAIAKQILSTHDIQIKSSTITPNDLPDNETAGGIVACSIEKVRAGIGNPIFGKLNAQLAAAMMSIPSAIGFEMGAGFATAQMYGSQYVDQWCRTTDGSIATKTNHCGGIQGGISNGMPITFRVAFHPIVTLPGTITCIDSEGTTRNVVVGGRHDRCQVGRASVVVEAMAALTILDNMDF